MVPSQQHIERVAIAPLRCGNQRRIVVRVLPADAVKLLLVDGDLSDLRVEPAGVVGRTVAEVGDPDEDGAA